MRIARALARLWLILPRRLRLRAARDQPIWVCLRYGFFAFCLRQKEKKNRFSISAAELTLRLRRAARATAAS